MLEDDTSNKCLQRKASVALLTADKTDFKIRKVIWCKMGDFIEIMGTNQEDIILHIYAPNLRTSQYIKQLVTELNGEMDKNETLAGA